MKMWTTEWMMLYVLLLLLGNIAIIAFNDRLNGDGEKRTELKKPNKHNLS